MDKAIGVMWHLVFGVTVGVFIRTCWQIGKLAEHLTKPWTVHSKESTNLNLSPEIADILSNLTTRRRRKTKEPADVS